MGLYFEDFSEGKSYTSPNRTITEADIVAFSGISGDYNPLHTDIEFAKESRFGQRIAHGLLGISVLTGLMARIGILDGTTVALLGIDKWQFLRPIFIGDTIHVRVTILGKHETSNPTQGVVFRKCELINQHGKVVQQGEMPVMVRRR